MVSIIDVRAFNHYWWQYGYDISINKEMMIWSNESCGSDEFVFDLIEQLLAEVFASVGNLAEVLDLHREEMLHNRS